MIPKLIKVYSIVFVVCLPLITSFQILRDKLDQRRKAFITCVDSNTTSTFFVCTCVADHNTMFSGQNEVYYCRAPSYLGCHFSLLESKQTYLVTNGNGVHKIYPALKDQSNVSIHIWNSINANIAGWIDITEQGLPLFQIQNGSLSIGDINMTVWAGHVIRIDFTNVEKVVNCLTLKFKGSMTYPFDVNKFKKSIPKPAPSTTKPIITTIKPTTAKLKTTTVKPVITTAKPIETTAKPITTTTKPIKTTAKPIITTTKPIKTTAKPISTRGTSTLTTVKTLPTSKKYVTSSRPTQTFSSTKMSTTTNSNIPITASPRKDGKSESIITTFTIAGCVAFLTLIGVGILMYRCKKQNAYKYNSNVRHTVGEDGVTTIRNAAHSFFNPNYDREFMDCSDPTY